MHPSQQTRRYANYESSNNMKPTEEAIEEKKPKIRLDDLAALSTCDARIDG